MSTRATEAESVLKEHMGYLPVSEMERRGVSRTEISRFVREAKLEKAAKGLSLIHISGLICFTECGVRSAVRIAVSISESHFFA